MTKSTWLLCALALTLFVSCRSNSHKAEKLDTKVDKSSDVQGGKVGLKDGNMVYQKKQLIAEELRDLQIDVYSLEDKVYGNQKYGSQGLYGLLKKCRLELTDKKNGGTGKLIWTEPLDRVTDKEEELKLGLDEEGKLVSLSEEFLKDRMERFKQYKRLLLKRENEYQEKLEVCQADLKSRKQDAEKEKTSQKEE